MRDRDSGLFAPPSYYIESSLSARGYLFSLVKLKVVASSQYKSRANRVHNLPEIGCHYQEWYTCERALA